MHQAHDPNERAVVAAALGLLHAGPRNPADLVDQLRRDGLLDFLAIDDAELLIDETLELLSVNDELWVSSDLTTAILLAPRLDKAVFTHCLTEAERAAGAIALHPDLLALDRYFDPDDGEMVLPDGGVVQVAYDDADFDDTGRVVGPLGWLDAFADGDTLSFVRRGTALTMLRVDVKAGAGGRERAVLRECFTAAAEDRGAARLDDIVRDALTVNDHLFRSAVRPLAELLAAEGLGVDGGFVGEAGVDFVARMHEARIGAHVASEFGFGGCCLDAFTLARRAFAATDDAPATPMHERPVAVAERPVAEALAHSDVARALVAYADLLDDDALEKLARFAEPFAELDGAPRAGGALLMALVVEQLGDFDTAASLVEQAVLADPSCLGAVDHFARQLALRGELDEAIRVRRMLDVGEDAELQFLLDLRPVRRTAAGRNEPCVCGSGRKYKACCMNKPAVLAPDRHATWLQHKLLAYAFSPMHRAALELLLEVASQSQSQRSRREAVADELLESGTVACWALFEGDVAEMFGSLYAHALPQVEQVMLADWLGRSLALYEVVAVERGVSLTLRDVSSGDTARVHDRTSSNAHAAGELLLARLGLVDDVLRYVGDALVVAPRHRERTLALVQTSPNAADMAVWFAEVTASSSR